MKLSPKTEEKIKKIALSYLEKGKPNWDIPHTLRAVYWMRKLIEREGGNEKILLTAMYFHDIGYPELQKDYDFNDLIKSKKNHAKIGAEESEKILKRFDEFSEKDMQEISYLILMHDDKEMFVKSDLEVSFNQQLVIEADGLAKIDWYNVKPNFDKKNTKIYFEYFKKRTLPCFRTRTGKMFLKKVIKKAEEYLDNM